LAHDLERRIRRAEHVDHIDRLLDISKRGIDLLTEKLFALVCGIDRNHAIALGHEIFHGEIAWPRRCWARANKRESAGVRENSPKRGVAMAVVIHANPGAKCSHRKIVGNRRAAEIAARRHYDGVHTRTGDFLDYSASQETRAGLSGARNIGDVERRY